MRQPSLPIPCVRALLRARSILVCPLGDSPTLREEEAEGSGKFSASAILAHTSATVESSSLSRFPLFRRPTTISPSRAYAVRLPSSGIAYASILEPRIRRQGTGPCCA